MLMLMLVVMLVVMLMLVLAVVMLPRLFISPCRSPGFCDDCPAHLSRMSGKDLAHVERRCTGLLEPGDTLKLMLIPIYDLWRCPDSKALSALCIFENREWPNQACNVATSLIRRPSMLPSTSVPLSQ